MTNSFKIPTCFILDHSLMSYRLPFFKQLADRGFDITVIHNGKIIENIDYIRQRSCKSLTFYGVQYRMNGSIDDFSIIVHMQNLRLINLWTITLNPFRRYKLIHWGIGVSSSKGLQNRKNFVSEIRDKLTAFSDAQILYSKFPLVLFSEKVVAKTFIAHNTVDNPDKTDYSNHHKDSFIFIGSLNKRKGLDILLKIFGQYLKLVNTPRIRKLVIIGEGAIKDELKVLASDLGIEKYVEFKGSISKSSDKKKFFSKAIASISPLQAGLSVLESFSYGIPFLSYRSAISGGEHLNIEDGYNGYLVKDEAELLEHMLNLNNDENLGKYLGRNAFEYYNEKRTMQNMVDSFEEAFNFVLNK